MTHRKIRPSSTSRRSFLQAAGAAAAIAAAGPVVLGAEDKAGAKLPIVGEGAFRYECHHGWGTLPAGFAWGETHGVAIDREGLVYIKHRHKGETPVDAIVVFDPQGKYVRSFGKEYHGGGHGIDVRLEGTEEFLYLSDVLHGVVAKTNLKGEVVWRKERPQEPMVYKPTDKYSPTNVAFAPGGGFYIGDGYGSHYVHEYDKDAKWVRTWGGEGEAAGKMRTPHGLWWDAAAGANRFALRRRSGQLARLQYFTAEGAHLSFLKEVSFPASVDTQGEILLIADLHARVSLFDKDNKLITHLGYNADWTKQVLEGFKMRTTPEKWQAGRFVHPHDACFDKDGNIFVTEWVPTGRVTKLVKV